MLVLSIRRIHCHIRRSRSPFYLDVRRADFDNDVNLAACHKADREVPTKLVYALVEDFLSESGLNYGTDTKRDVRIPSEDHSSLEASIVTVQVLIGRVPVAPRLLERQRLCRCESRVLFYDEPRMRILELDRGLACVGQLERGKAGVDDDFAVREFDGKSCAAEILGDLPGDDERDDPIVVKAPEEHGERFRAEDDVLDGK